MSRSTKGHSSLIAQRPIFSSVFIGTILLLSACAGKPVVIASASSCVALLPPEWKNGVTAPDLPSGDTVGDWVAFADSTVGKLDQANGRSRDIIHICTKVEENNAKAIDRGTRSWLGRLFG